jgi:hypothetical protein
MKTLPASTRWLPLLSLLLASSPLGAQELEPRSLQNSPVGLNFLLAGVGYSHGNLLVDAALPLEDATADVENLMLAAFRSVGILGMNGRIGVVMPFATGKWSGTLAGIDTSTSRTGLADPGVVLGLNFIGAPALSFREFGTYHQHTVVGIQLAMLIPLGQYYPDRLINLSSHRWAFTPRLGVSQALGRWDLEAYAGATFYTKNGDYYGGKVLTQDPFYQVQGHLVYTFRTYPSWWAAVSAGYGWGGRASIDGVEKDPLKNTRVSALLRIPLARSHGLKLVYINGLSTRLGADFDTFQAVYSYTFGAPRPPAATAEPR